MSTDLIVLMGEGCGARARARQAAAWRVAWMSEAKSGILQQGKAVPHFAALMRATKAGPRFARTSGVAELLVWGVCGRENLYMRVVRRPALAARRCRPGAESSPLRVRPRHSNATCPPTA